VINQKAVSRFDWVDGVKAFAIIAILLNHFVEQFGEGPWFSNPSYNWPPFSERIASIIPEGSNWVFIFVKFLGWLGDMGPGVFILLSGFTLTISQLRNEKSVLTFYRSRILRIFPLYIAIHIIVLIFILIVNFPPGFKIFSPSVLLSLSGLRFNNGLFFFINPSWWFIWLIIQLYLLFPGLFYLLKKKGLAFFLIATFAITIISRLAGILNLTYTNNLYFWMTGLFAGTRVFEFTVGMGLANLLINRPDQSKLFQIKKSHKLLIFIGLYAFGFVCSWSFWGSLFSNILITIGLSGIFYLSFNFLSVNTSIRKTLLYLGTNSFSVFLIHQPFMQFASEKLAGIPKIIVLIAIIIIAFPLGYFIEKIVNMIVARLSNHYQQVEKLILSHSNIVFIYVLTFLIFLSNTIFIVIPVKDYGITKVVTAFYIVTLAGYIFAFTYKNKRYYKYDFLLLFISAITFSLILPPDWSKLISISILLLLILFHGFNFLLKPLAAFILTLILIGIGFYSTEQYLRINRPLETAQWGELPALRTDTNTVYSLIPDKTTHLKYNNYDYVVKTNSLGFASPEIDLKKSNPELYRIFIVGDAFSMPEGLNYENSYPSLLEKALELNLKTKQIEVINGGVTGYGPNEELAQLKYYIDTLKPDLIINEFFINEFEEINLSPLERLKSIGLISERTKRLKYFGPSQIMLHYRNWLRSTIGIIDNEYVYNKSLLPLYEKTSEYYSDSVTNKIDTYLEELKELADKKGSKLLLMYVPGQIEVSKPEDISYYPGHFNLADTTKFDFNISHKIVKSLCEKHSINLLDTKDLLKTNPVQPVYFEGSWHWNSAGHEIIAQTLANHIIKTIYLHGNK